MSLEPRLSLWLYVGLVALIAAERLLELKIAKRNAASMMARGGFEVGREHYPWMVLLHTSILFVCPLEAWLLSRPLIPGLATVCLCLIVATMALRYWVIRTLGDRWTTRILVVPGETSVLRGPFRHLRHPNYLAVCLELLALPLVHTAWWSAIVFFLANGLVLRRRISLEEQALSTHGAEESDLGHLPRFFPRARREGKRNHEH